MLVIPAKAGLARRRAASRARTHTILDGDGSNTSIAVNGFDSVEAPVVTIQNIDVSGNAADDGITIVAALVAVIDSVVSGNQGNGILVSEGARELQAPAVVIPQVTVTNADVSDNLREGIEVDAGQAIIEGSLVSRNGVGGVVVESGFASIDSSTLDGNVGAGVVADGSNTQVALAASTVANTVPFADDEGESYGGGVLVFGGEATIGTSTLSGNTGQGVMDWLGVVSVANSTISGTLPNPKQTSLLPGGVTVDDQIDEDARTTAASQSGSRAASWPRALRSATTAAAATLTVSGTIVAAQAATVPDCSGAVQDGGYNLDSDGSCAWSAAGSVSGVDPQLGPLADNGGPTATLLPAGGSAALDAIPSGQAGCGGTLDQRGVDRPQPAAGNCDIGAVEVRQVLLTVVVGAHGSATASGTAGLIGAGIGTCSAATCTASYENEAGVPGVSLVLAADAGFKVDSVTGCDGNLSGSTYLTAPLTAACTVQVVFAPGITQTVVQPAPALDSRLLALLAVMLLLLAPVGLRRR